MMDWMTLAAAWGPAFPVLFVLLKAHYDVIYKVFPNGIREIKNAIQDGNRKSAARHREHIAWQKRVVELLTQRNFVEGETRKKKRPTKRRAKKKDWAAA